MLAAAIGLEPQEVAKDARTEPRPVRLVDFHTRLGRQRSRALYPALLQYKKPAALEDDHSRLSPDLKTHPK